MEGPHNVHITCKGCRYSVMSNWFSGYLKCPSRNCNKATQGCLFLILFCHLFCRQIECCVTCVAHELTILHQCQGSVMPLGLIGTIVKNRKVVEAVGSSLVGVAKYTSARFEDMDGNVWQVQAQNPAHPWIQSSLCNIKPYSAVKSACLQSICAVI